MAATSMDFNTADDESDITDFEDTFYDDSEEE